MHHIFHLGGLMAAVVLPLAYAVWKRAEGTPIVTTQGRAELSLGELQKWGVFLVGLQTAAIGVMGFMFDKARTTGGPSPVEPLSELHFTIGVLALESFGASIIVATWLLGALPSMHLRVNEQPCTSNDIFHMSLFESPQWPQVGPMTGLQFVLFSIGIVFFAAFVYMLVPHA